MDDLEFILGLMRQNTDALGFIPKGTIQKRYMRQGNVILVRDERGKKIGYLLHGPIYQGKMTVISQHCIEFDKRQRGFGATAVRELIERCMYIGASGIRLRCATNLEAIDFWQSCGFQIVKIVPGGNARGRMIAEMVLLFHNTLFD